MNTTVLPEQWGRDHWSTLLYLDHVVRNQEGEPRREKMRCDPEIHPGLASPHHTLFSDKKYPTTLRNGQKLHGHDDWSCINDMEAAGFLEWRGTGMHPLIHITDPGYLLIAELSKYRNKNKVTEGFEPSFEVVMSGRMHARNKELGIE